MAVVRTGRGDAAADALAEAKTISDGGDAHAENVFSVAPGTLLCGKYRVVKTLGRGGMGTVVEAFHLELQVPVAIKLLLPELMSYAEAAVRFQREARAVTKLTSPHVARVLDVDTLPSGEPFIVMEFLKGKDLAERGKDPIPLSLSEALDYVVQASDAIAEAHSVGIIHRDLKPANLFVTHKPGGEPFIKVLDFGVSKVLTGNTGEVSLTQTTTILGSALYMSPEQMRSARDVDHRTDVYALGACLYEILAGRPPYVASSFPELCARVYSGPPMSVSEWSPEVPPDLAKVIEKSLAHEREDRYGSIAEFVHALAPYATEETRDRIEAILKQHAPHLTLPPIAKRKRNLEPTPRSEPPPAESSSKVPWVAVALLLLVGVVGIGAALRTKLPFFAAPTAGTSPPSAPTDPRATLSGVPISPSGSDSTVASAPDAPGSASSPLPSSFSSSASPAQSVTNSSSPAAATSSAAVAVAPTPSARSVSTAVATEGRTTPPASSPPSTPPATSTQPAGSTQPIAPGGPAVNPGLTEQVCYAIFPDGTRKEVPCQ
ncbi:MAG: serine/threonine protein kinase [Polyangiaceae bacterium]|nr:serine/threonine protein kinase [Polyangiaceae bacterium]